MPYTYLYSQHLYKSLNKGFEKSTEGKCFGWRKLSGRLNANDIDLNRDFPTWNDLDLSKSQLMENRQPETAAVIDWVLSQPWVLSANFHDGAVVALYPYSDRREYGEGWGKKVGRVRGSRTFKQGILIFFF